MIGKFRFVHSFGHYVFEKYNPLFEGGKVFDDTQRINKDDVDRTIGDIKKRLFPALGLNDENTFKVGSAGHTETSGDIDFGVIGKNLEELKGTMELKFPENKTNFLKGLEVLSIEWPINGSEKYGMVQVDFVPVYNRAWTEFVYRYPEGSAYKSAHRNWLIMAILSTIKENEEFDENDQPISYDGVSMNLNKGMFSITKNYRGKTKILKHGQVEDKELVTDDPDKFVSYVFGRGITPDDVKTFEDCWHIINTSDFKWAEKIEDIKQNLKKFLSRVNLEVPKELD